LENGKERGKKERARATASWLGVRLRVFLLGQPVYVRRAWMAGTTDELDSVDVVHRETRLGKGSLEEQRRDRFR